MHVFLRPQVHVFPRTYVPVFCIRNSSVRSAYIGMDTWHGPAVFEFAASQPYGAPILRRHGRR